MNPILPKHWQEPHVVACLLRESIYADGQADPDELGYLKGFGMYISADSITVTDVYDDVDTFMASLAKSDEPKYLDIMKAARDYIAENYDNDQKNMLITGMMNIVSLDNIIKYKEFVYLRWCMDGWFVYQIEEFIDDLKKRASKIDFPDTTKIEDPESWTIIHDIGVFYTYFGNLADGGIKNPEKEYINLTLPKWNLRIGDIDYGFDNGNPTDIGETLDCIFNEMYDESDPNPPMIRVNVSHKNLVNYFNNNHIQKDNIGTFLHTLFHLSIYDGIISRGQAHQLTYYCSQWSSMCPKAATLIDLLKIALQGQQLRKELIADGIPPEMLPPCKIDPETGKMEFNPEIFPDGDPLGEQEE